MWCIIINLSYALFLGAWRRCFGSDGWGFPVLKNRFVQHVIGFSACFGILLFNDIHWIQCVLAGLVLQGLVWSIGHGAAFDLSRGGYPDEKTIKRYKEHFWNKWCEFLVPESSWYGFGYDFLWMLFRYTLPVILMSIILVSPYVLIGGLLVSPIYAVCWSLYDKGKLIRLNATQLAEIISGFVIGFTIAFL